jgi:hypothetical protein
MYSYIASLFSHPEQTTGKLLVCSKQNDNQLRKHVSNQLRSNGIAHESIGKTNNFYSLNGHSNLVLLVVDFGTNLRLLDPSADAGYKDEMEVAKRLSHNGQLVLIVFKDLSTNFNHAHGHKYIEVDSRLTENNLMQIKKLMSELKGRRDNIQIDLKEVPQNLKPAIFQDDKGEYLIVWSQSVKIQTITSTTVTLSSTSNSAHTENFSGDLSSFTEQIKKWNATMQQPFCINLSSNTTLEVIEVKINEMVGIIVRSKKC